ncbi:MAG: hypothetical protein ACRD3E_08145 [Terriglobales bacterium]
MNGSRALILFVLFGTLSLWAQAPNLNPQVPPEQQIPVVKFEFVLPGGNPPHYALSIEAGGAAAYRSDAEPATGSTPGVGGEQPYFLKFDISHITADKIFALAKDLNFFQGDFEYHGGRVANMGAKTLTFKDGQRENSFTYNYSQNPQLQQLGSLLQGIASAVEYRRELEQLYRYEKLGLEDKLRQMENAVNSGYVADLGIDAPILRQIVNDHSVMNITRRRAEKLLAKAGK